MQRNKRFVYILTLLTHFFYYLFKKNFRQKQVWICKNPATVSFGLQKAFSFYWRTSVLLQLYLLQFDLQATHDPMCENNSWNDRKF